MCRIVEGALEFIFPDGWQAEKLDDSGFYRKHFQSFADSKSVDVAVIPPGQAELWLVEVKDYRTHPRSKMLDVFQEIATKVRDSLALLYLAKSKPESALHGFAQMAAATLKIRVALHLEQPAKPSKLYPPVVQRNNAQLKLAQAVRVVDPHPLFCEMSSMPPSCPWAVMPMP